MADESKSDRAKLEQLLAVEPEIKLLMEKGLIAEADTEALMAAERAKYLTMLKGMH